MGRYFARFGELRTILGANKNKGGKRSGVRLGLAFGMSHSSYARQAVESVCRKLLVAYCRKVNAKKSQQHVHGAEASMHQIPAM